MTLSTRTSLAFLPSPVPGRGQGEGLRFPLLAPRFSLLASLLLLSLPAFAQNVLLTKDSKRECATCHLDWSDSFERPGAILLIDKPTKPAAAEEPSCLGCHDGSVGDSRRGVWLEHGHRRNEKPTDKIKVPEKMPLDEGKMVCRTCHTAHTVPGQNDISKIVFLRSATEGGLCQQCHVDRAYGAEHTSHPLAKLPFELPKELHDAHARTDPTDRMKMACQTCHTAHGALQDKLLVMATDSAQLCVTCHSKLRPEEWKIDKPREHPQNPPLQNAGQKQAIQAMGTRLGPKDTLICLSCHKMHDAKTGKFMLADTLQDSSLCIRCHEDRKQIISSKHDLRQSRPEEKNKLNLTAHQSGPCGACHSFHQYAREPAPGKIDPSGRCITCHVQMADAGSPQAKPQFFERPLNFAHPPSVSAVKLPQTSKLKMNVDPVDQTRRTFECTTCHDPHDANKSLFLRQPKDQVCSTCHVDRFTSMAGKHDFTKKPELLNAKGLNAEQAGKCGFCHAVHGDTNLVLWVGTKDMPKGPDDLCIQCHRKDGLAHDKPLAAFNHPTGPKATPTSQPSDKVKLFNEHALIDSKGFVSCASCHDPHADSTKQKEMLRVASPTSQLCGECHADKMQLATGPHDARGKDNWPAKPSNTDLCTSCHQPHSNDPAKARFTVPLAGGVAKSDAACVSCHKDQVWAATDTAPKGRAMHPTTLPSGGYQLVKTSGLPMAKSADDKDQIGCKTCHNPHAPVGTRKMARIDIGQPPAALCAKCHTDALNVAHSMHAADAMAAAGTDPRHGIPVVKPTDDRTCSPCHATHSIEGSERKFLWALKSEPSDPNGKCLSCHDATADLTRPLEVRHPVDPLRTLNWSKDPKIAAAGKRGEIHCTTCHNTHGDKVATKDAPAQLDVRRANRTMVRSDLREQCAYCHGVDASRRILYWHWPAKRAANAE